MYIFFKITNIKKIYEILLKNGINFFSKPQISLTGVKWVYSKDPDGIIIEFIELLME